MFIFSKKKTTHTRILGEKVMIFKSLKPYINLLHNSPVTWQTDNVSKWIQNVRFLYFTKKFKWEKHDELLSTHKNHSLWSPFSISSISFCTFSRALYAAKRYFHFEVYVRSLVTIRTYYPVFVKKIAYINIIIENKWDPHGKSFWTLNQKRNLECTIAKNPQNLKS